MGEETFGPLLFEWYPPKAEANRQKHGVSFQEASTAFRDPTAAVLYDSGHSLGTEDRYILIGRTESGRLTTVVFCERGSAYRIISARLSTRSEADYYEHEAR